MTREEIKNSNEYKATNAALEWWYSLPQEQKDATNIDAEPDIIDAYEQGYLKALQERDDLLNKACEWLRAHLGAPAGIPQAKSYNDAINELTTEFRKAMSE